MRIKSTIIWSLGVLISATLLVKIPVPEAALTVAELKRNESLELDKLAELTATQCRSITSLGSLEIEREFIRSLKPSHSQSIEHCFLKVQESVNESYYLKKNLALNISIFQTTNKNIVYQNTFVISYLMPLALLPFAAFFIALLLGVPFVTPLRVFISLFFFYSALNPIEFLNHTFSNLGQVFYQDKNLLGLCFLFLWSRIAKERQIKPLVSKCLFFLFGSWNPAFIIATRKCFLQLGSSIKAKSVFLSLQTLFLMISFSLLGITANVEDLFLPRYFTYAFFIVFAFQQFASPFGTLKFGWKMPFRIIHIPAVLLGEIAFHYLHPQTPFILRLAIELIIADLPNFSEWQFKAEEGKFLLSRVSLFVFSSFAAFAASRLGILNLLFHLFQMESFELGLPFALFAFGIVSGVIFGSIAIPYFFILASFSQVSGYPVVKAGLMDGLVLGTLLSPLSIFNWFTSKDINLSVQGIILQRIRALRLSVFAGAVVYLVSGLNSVKILQPVTFLFLLLVIFVNHMRTRKWKWISGMNEQGGYSAPHSI